MSSAESEDRFRRIFLAQLESDGFSAAESYQLIFKTPPPFHHVPTNDSGLRLLDAFQESYERQLPHSWFFEGLNRRPEADPRWLQPPVQPVTLVVIPGIFGEFIEQIPFQSIVDNKASIFRQRWQGALQQASDMVYSLTLLQEAPCSLADVVKIGSLDRDDRSFANVIVLKATGGSLETLGLLGSNAEVIERRLTKVFQVIDDGTDVYLVGYSRGLAVFLELVSSLYERSRAHGIPESKQRWFERIKGIVGLGGVYYGAQFAREALSDKPSATSDLVRLLRATADSLATIPAGATLVEKREFVRRNTGVWAGLVRQLTVAKLPKIGAGKAFLELDLADIFAKESKARILARDVPVPNPWGIFSLVNGFFLRTFALTRFITRYNENITALKQLVDAIIDAVRTLTPESRDQWWRSHELPRDILLFSITGTMPDAFLEGFDSPLWRFTGFGARTADYNVALRASYYDTLAAEGTLINDSALSHFGSRYWAEMYPDHRYTHYYLGVLGTHHWGMAFPFAIKDDKRIGTNAFPRDTLLKSVASFISSLDRDRPGS